MSTTKTPTVFVALFNRLEDEPHRFATEDAAREYLATIIEEHTDEIRDDAGTTVAGKIGRLEEAALQMRMSPNGPFSVRVDGTVYEIQTVDPEDDEEARRLALALEIDEPLEDIEVCAYDSKTFECGNEQWLVCTDDEADELWEEQLDSYLDDCILCELDGPLAQYFDREAWKRDARHDGRGHAISSYDGGESTSECGQFVMFRIN